MYYSTSWKAIPTWLNLVTPPNLNQVEIADVFHSEDKHQLLGLYLKKY